MEDSYRLATYADSHAKPRAGLVVDDRLIDVSVAMAMTPLRASTSSFNTVLEVLQDWAEISPRLCEIARNVRNEKLLVTPRQIEKWAQSYELNLFTGRTRQEFSYTFERWPATKYFRTIVTMDDAEKKPHPEGLQKILGQRDPAAALYLGDNIDDALAARAVGVPFMAIIAPGEGSYRQRAARFRKLGALALLPHATELNRWLK